ncbi:helicase-exonuclease AddAB subunit AddA [Acetilactobacillus jinshanensis]|uniref:DNA 3'-5' helicase n=1 Tax=Acetilactobacillus jinshanensis TaxID=1720083 RepID=A0A4P6ZKE5_9LACO|nr:helicase-exonuclease AddAB subunit AddA [Acetilactobacillus jinshanensis]QBP18128.1 helicase-exonuclease AddAB subunit AddA [Acetilactobacillus jinshanensis]URL60992.1 helicase-exonuclease AddAB subunit AddA [uncultured bacterium]
MIVMTNDKQPRYDEQQERVIRIRNKGNLLVSASAGAGKTTVLVNRVVNQLLPKDLVFSKGRTYGIGNFLIVTFTRAAAKELSSRIQAQLQKKITNDMSQPDKEALLRQIGDLPTSNIGTLDSFCQRIVERYYYYLKNFDPHFRILNDNTEVTLLRDEVWKNVREDLYTSGDHKFRRLASNFFSQHIDSDDQLTDPLTTLVYALYNSFKRYIFVDSDHDKMMAVNSDYDKLFKAWCDYVTQMYQVSKSFKQSPLYQKLLYKQMDLRLSQILDKYKRAISITNKYGLDSEYKVVKSEFDAISQLQKMIKPDSEYSWNQIRKGAKNVTVVCGQKFPSKRKTKDKVQHNIVHSYRNAGKDAYCENKPNSFINTFFMFDEAANMDIIKKSGQIIDELLNVVRAFDKAYTQVKKQRHVMEFIDIERAALKILETSQDVRDHFQNQFHEIMIDEYQDDNELQDAIIKLVAKHNPKTGDTTNVFMVGDVKQSIYRFRSADPKLFLHKDHAYNKPNPNGNQEIILSRNYRSTQNIDRFVNWVFTQVMDEKLGGINYYYQPERYGATEIYDNNSLQNHKPIKIMIYANDKKQSKSQDSATKTPDKDGTDYQIEMVAQEIRRLVDNPKNKIYDKQSHLQRSVQFKDIALLASTRDDNAKIADIFRKYHIPVQMLGSQDYFKATEVQIMLSLLNIIDNPDQDIPLVAVLRSPMVGLDENQLAYLRINSKTGNYYQAVKTFYQDYQSNNEHKDSFVKDIYNKVKQFLMNLSKFRKITQRHGLVDLIWSIYQTTGFLDYVGGMPAGVQRQANLHALYQRAAQYEQANFHGLFQFVQFIRQLQNQQKDLTDAVPQQGKDVVSSITIHNSKGREFPIVFLLDASQKFNPVEFRQDYILSNDLGLGMKYYNRKLHAESNSLPYQCLINYEKREDLSEQMRKLYVAFTRARQRLYIIGQVPKRSSVKRMIANWEDAADSSHQLLDLADRAGANNYMDWIGASLVRLPSFQKDYADDLTKPQKCADLKNEPNVSVKFYSDDTINEAENKFNLNASIKLISEPLTDKEKRTIKDVIFMKYPHQIATQEGNYRSVSDVKQLFDDPNKVEMGELDQQNHQDHHGRSNQYVTGDFAKPQFMQDGAEPKATAIGTATHLVFQMLDLHKDQCPTIKQIDDKITDLTNYQMIDKPVADKMLKYHTPQKVQAFFKTRLGKLILTDPDNYHREAPFSLLIKANQIFDHGFGPKDPESILIHGIIDGYFYDQKTGDVYLVDYKTDYVDFQNEAASIAKIKDRYQGQLRLYAKALKSVYSENSLRYKGLYLLSTCSLEQIKD